MGALNKKIDNLKEFYLRCRKDKDGCVRWIGSTSKHGYGQVQSMGFNKAHRLSYFLHFGDFERSLFVLHKCDVRNCVNPEHLFLGTQQDNMKDCSNKKRIVNKPHKGEDSHLAKLTANQVLEMRQEHKTTKNAFNKIAKKYNISTMTCYRAITKKSWSHI